MHNEPLRADRDRHGIEEALYFLTRELGAIRETWLAEQAWRRQHADFATKSDLRSLEHKVNIMAATQKELVADLQLVNARQIKTAGEIATLSKGSDVLAVRVKELEDIVAAGGEVTQELIDAVASVKTQAQVVDDLIPDVVPGPVIIPPTDPLEPLSAAQRRTRTAAAASAPATKMEPTVYK